MLNTTEIPIVVLRIEAFLGKSATPGIEGRFGQNILGYQGAGDEHCSVSTIRRIAYL